jgi:hypothetical protein
MSNLLIWIYLGEGERQVSEPLTRAYMSSKYEYSYDLFLIYTIKNLYKFK